MQQARRGSGRLPDERFHTDNLFNSIAQYVARSRAFTNLRTRERTTGADALMVISGPTGVWRYAIQAKSLISHIQGDVARDADPPHYARLDHPTRDGRQQYDLLLAACAPGGELQGYVPIHVFYNELTIPFLTPGEWACESVFPGDRGEFGVTYARTEDVKVIADARLGLKLQRRARFPSHLFHDVSRPWLCLLCTLGGGCTSGSRSSPWPPLLARDEIVGNAGLDPRPEFTPGDWPDRPIQPEPWTSSSDDDVTATLLRTLTEDDAVRLQSARDVVRPYARAALVAESSPATHPGVG
jgi:hypothetical protein